MPDLGTPELVIIALIVIFLFGGKKIPELFKGLGEAVGLFKKAVTDEPESSSKKKKSTEST